MLGARRVGRNVRQIDVGLRGGRQFNLGLFGGFFESLQRQHVLGQIDALVLAKLRNNVIHDALIEVLATQEGIAIGGQHLELLFTVHIRDFDNGNVEGAAAQVKHRHLRITLQLLIQAERQGSCGGLVDDAFHVQARNTARVLGGLPLRVVEVRGHGDDGFRNRVAHVRLGRGLHFPEHFGGDLRRGHPRATGFNPGVAVGVFHNGVGNEVAVLLHFCVVEFSANEALGGVDGIGRVGDGLAFGGGADQNVVVGVGDHGGSRSSAFAVFDDSGGRPLDDGHARVGGAEVDADDGALGGCCHDENSLLKTSWACEPPFQGSGRP